MIICLEAKNQTSNIFGKPEMVCCGSRGLGARNGCGKRRNEPVDVCRSHAMGSVIGRVTLLFVQTRTHLTE
jgi:hypothetical protein